MSGLHRHEVSLRHDEQKKLAEDAKQKEILQHVLIAKIVREHYGVSE